MEHSKSADQPEALRPRRPLGWAIPTAETIAVLIPPG
jgi:hypothetical protein